MKTVWKFEILVGGPQEIDLPISFTLLSVLPGLVLPGFTETVNLYIEGKQEDFLVRKTHWFQVFATGEPIPDRFDYSYLGTADTGNGSAWHLYRIPAPESEPARLLSVA